MSKLSNLQKSQLQFLEETRVYYKTHERGVDKDGHCVYLATSGARCAIGKELSKKLAKTCTEITGDVSCVWDELPEKLTNLGQNFLLDMQDFHDENDYWLKRGKGWVLTAEGREEFNQIRNNILDKIYS